MKKVFSLIATAILAVGFTACSQSDLLEDNGFSSSATSNDNAVQFGTYMGKTGTTRAYVKGAIGNATDAAQGITDLKEAQFGVFAYLTTDDYNPATPTSLAPGFMYNQQITWNASAPAAWVYSPVKYWPNGIDAANASTPSNTALQKTVQKLSFFAVAPFVTTPSTAYDASTDGAKPSAITDDADVKKNALTNGINAMTTNAFTGNVWVKYLLPTAQEDEAVDLLWGVRGDFQYTETDNTNNPASAYTSLTGNEYNINLTKQTVGEKVKFLFKHALTKIGGQTFDTENANATPDLDKVGFKIVADVDVNTEATTGDHDNQTAYFGSDFSKAQTLITLKSIKIQDGKTATDDGETPVTGISATGIYNSGWFNIETGTWDAQASTGTGSTINIVAKSADANQTYTTDTEYSINPEIREVTTYVKYGESGDKKLADGGATWDDATGPTGVYTTAVPVFAKETIPGLTLIPGTANQNLYITVDYLVRTADPNLATGYSQVEQVISNKVSLSSLQPNKFYTIIIHLGMTSVKFEAVVADWQTTVGGTYAEDGTFTPGTGGDADPIESHFWLPSNVVTP